MWLFIIKIILMLSVSNSFTIVGGLEVRIVNPYIKLYYYSDGSKESKKLFSEGTAKAFAESGIDALDINEGDRFHLMIEEKEVEVRVCQKAIQYGKDAINDIEYHVAPVEVSPYQFNK